MFVATYILFNVCRRLNVVWPQKKRALLNGQIMKVHCCLKRPSFMAIIWDYTRVIIAHELL